MRKYKLLFKKKKSKDPVTYKFIYTNSNSNENVLYSHDLHHIFLSSRVIDINGINSKIRVLRYSNIQKSGVRTKKQSKDAENLDRNKKLGFLNITENNLVHFPTI